jgi:hypothetical protein
MSCTDGSQSFDLVEPGRGRRAERGFRTSDSPPTIAGPSCSCERCSCRQRARCWPDGPPGLLLEDWDPPTTSVFPVGMGVDYHNDDSRPAQLRAAARAIADSPKEPFLQMLQPICHFLDRPKLPAGTIVSRVGLSPTELVRLSRAHMSAPAHRSSNSPSPLHPRGGRLNPTWATTLLFAFVAVDAIGDLARLELALVEL